MSPGAGDGGAWTLSHSELRAWSWETSPQGGADAPADAASRRLSGTVISVGSQGRQEGAAIILLIIIDVASTPSAAFLSSAILDAIQKTPAEILARGPCVCQGQVIGVALEQREGQPLGPPFAVILMKVRILY